MTKRKKYKVVGSPKTVYTPRGILIDSDTLPYCVKLKRTNVLMTLACCKNAKKCSVKRCYFREDVN